VSEQAEAFRALAGEQSEQYRFSRDRDRGYPRQTQLPVPAENPGDASIKLGLVPYHGIAPQLNSLQKRSNRVSAEIIGRTRGRGTTGQPLAVRWIMVRMVTATCGNTKDRVIAPGYPAMFGPKS
jgi:hypothetical protein